MFACFQVIKDLRFIRACDRRQCLDLSIYFSIANEIRLINFGKEFTLVPNFHHRLRNVRYPLDVKFSLERLLVYRLQKARPKFPVHFHGGTNDFVCTGIFHVRTIRRLHRLRRLFGSEVNHARGVEGHWAVPQCEALCSVPKAPPPATMTHHGVRSLRSPAPDSEASGCSSGLCLKARKS